jgi:hypothetical protein
MKSGSVTEVLTTTTKSEQDDIFRQQRVSVCTWCVSPARYMASMFGAALLNTESAPGSLASPRSSSCRQPKQKIRRTEEAAPVKIKSYWSRMVLKELGDWILRGVKWESPGSSRSGRPRSSRSRRPAPSPPPASHLPK